MTILLDLRATTVGGLVASDVRLIDSRSGDAVSDTEFRAAIQGRNVVLATHGYNVDRRDGLDALVKWGNLAALPNWTAFVGVLWPGDSRFLPILDYPVEGNVAVQAGELLATFINARLTGVPQLSMVSHSLGARVFLAAINKLQRRISTLILMASAIENDCLTAEYKLAASRVDRLRVVASRQDFVLRFGYPILNPIGDILRSGHPYFRQALGLEGVDQNPQAIADFQPWQLPDDWDYGHLDYMPGDVVDARMPPPIDIPSPHDPSPRSSLGWQSSWSAGVIAQQFG